MKDTCRDEAVYEAICDWSDFMFATCPVLREVMRFVQDENGPLS